MAEAPWPRGATFEGEGLAIHGRPASALAREFGTPLVVVDEAHLRERCRDLREAFPGAMWAVHAFPAPALIRIAADEGLGLLAATGGEIAACMRAGVGGERIAFHGGDKLDEEILVALRAGVGLFVVESEEELGRIDGAAAAAGTVLSVLLRLSLPLDARGEGGDGADARFGVPVEGGAALRALKDALDRANLDVAGIHLHLGSRPLDAAPYLAALEAALDFLAEARSSLGFEARILDLGGGMGVRSTDESPPAFRPLADELRRHLIEGSGERDLPVPDLLVEPGHAVTANATVTLSRVGTITEMPAAGPFVAVDGGFSDHPSLALYGTSSTIAVAASRRSAPSRPCTVVGRHPEPADVLGRNVLLPADLQRGDLLAVAATGGAYAMAGTYNRVGRPAVVLVSSDRARVILRREDEADLARLEVVPDPPEEAAPPEGVTIRPARPRDARAVMSLIAAVAAEGRYIRTERLTTPSREFRRRFRRSWTVEGAELVAVVGGRVVGHLGIVRESRQLRHVASLGMSLLRDWRGRGIGSALMAETIRWARWAGVEKLTLSAFPHNAAALGLYRKFGFIEEGRLRRHTRKQHGYEDEIVMARWV